MLAIALALAVAAVCPVEKAQYTLRHMPGVTLSFIPITASRDWPSGIAMVEHSADTGHTYYFLPWQGGSDDQTNVTHTTDVTQPDFQLPSPDGGPGRLGDMEYIATDAGYDIINHAPVRGDPAPAHILISGLSDSSWRQDSVAKAFFDFDGCASAAK